MQEKQVKVDFYRENQRMSTHRTIQILLRIPYGRADTALLFAFIKGWEIVHTEK